MAHQAGSATDLERLMEEYGTGLLQLCALQLGDAVLVGGVAQETLLRAWRRYDIFREEVAERTQIIAIALNVCQDPLRSPWRTRRTELSTLIGPSAEGVPWGDAPLRAVLSLPQKYREVVLLRHYEESTLEEVTDTLGIALNTVPARPTRAKRRLWPILEE